MDRDSRSTNERTTHPSSACESKGQKLRVKTKGRSDRWFNWVISCGRGDRCVVKNEKKRGIYEPRTKDVPQNTYLNPGPRLGLAGSVVVVVVRFRVERNRPQPPSRVGAAPAGEELGAAALPGGDEVPFSGGWLL